MAEEVKGTELAALLGQTEDSVTVKGEKIKVAPLVLTQIARVLECIDRLSERGVVQLQGQGGIFSKDFNPMKLALRGGVDFIEILSIACNQSVEWAGSLNALETAQVVGKVWEINKDFFDQNRAALLGALGLATSDVLGIALTLMEKLLGKLGQQPSNASSAQATGSTKLKGTRSSK